MYKSLEPISSQLRTLDTQFCETFHDDFEEGEKKSQAEHEVQGYVEKITMMEAYYGMLEYKLPLR